MYRLVDAAEINTYGPVVDQPDVHHRAEDAVLDALGAVQRAHLADEAVVELFAFGRWGGLVEVGLVAFFGRGQEGELGDWWRERGNVSEGEI